MRAQTRAPSRSRSVVVPRRRSRARELLRRPPYNDALARGRGDIVTDRCGGTTCAPASTTTPPTKRSPAVLSRQMLTLYFSPGSSSMAAHIALHEVGATFEATSVSFARREHHAPAFRAINPAGKVPALLIDGRLLTEVAGILFYLARRFP